MIHTEKQHSQIEIESVEAPIYSIDRRPVLEIVESPTSEETIVSEPTVEVEETTIETEELVATIETPIEIPVEIPLDIHIIEPSNTPIVLDDEDYEEDFESEFISLNIRGNEEVQPEQVEVTVENEPEPIIAKIEDESEFVELEESTIESSIEEVPEIEQLEDPVIEKFERNLF